MQKSCLLQDLTFNLLAFFFPSSLEPFAGVSTMAAQGLLTRTVPRCVQGTGSRSSIGQLGEDAVSCMSLPSGSLLQVLRAESKADADSLLQALAHIDSLGACI